MSHPYHCSNCYHNNNAGDCPHSPRPESGFCASYKPDGDFWNAIRPCEQCRHLSNGLCGLTGIYLEYMDDAACPTFQEMLRQAERETPAVPRFQGGAVSAPAQDSFSNDYPPAPDESENSFDDDPPAPRYIVLHEDDAGQAPPSHGGQPRSRRSSRHRSASQGNKDGYKSGSSSGKRSARHDRPHTNPADKPPPVETRPAPVEKPIREETHPAPADPPARQTPAHPPEPQPPRKRNPHLYFLNPSSLLGMLFIFLAYGLIFCCPRWREVPWQTGVCLLALSPCLGLVSGLLWGVMNPQCRPVRFALSACMGVCVGRMFWTHVSFSAMLGAVFAGFCAMCVCFFASWLGTKITNAIFRVNQRMRRYLPDRPDA